MYMYTASPSGTMPLNSPGGSTRARFAVCLNITCFVAGFSKCGFSTLLSCSGFIICSLLPAIRSLERARYLFYCMFFVCFFVRSTISQQPAGRFTPTFACGRSLGRDVTSSLLGVGGPRRAEKRANEIFATIGVNGEFRA